MKPAFISISVMSGPRDGETLRFVPDPTSEEFVLEIGRREDCAIPLTYDSQVSRLHAKLIFEHGRFWIEDLESRNGTYIQHKQIKKRSRIEPSTLFRVGRTWLRLDSLPPDETQSIFPFDDSDIPF